ncbi:hypothetical protein GJ698_14965 [Pseudoduganella sp. FT26W]|uniref:Uncharacterized protein n=1 Tax=Duganella aquatilis TaxID=2666082 RepID=A0A844D6A2_9BURK|nr:hypothetical protein [Duganella aquatilis]MRW85385.1 hypothetical protein [Duganella aquatilis]
MTTPTPTDATADQLLAAAFNASRDPRSTECRAGALRFRIDGRNIPRPYSAGTAADDAYHAGIAEGRAIWRAAAASAAGAA